MRKLNYSLIYHKVRAHFLYWTFCLVHELSHFVMLIFIAVFCTSRINLLSMRLKMDNPPRIILANGKPISSTYSARVQYQVYGKLYVWGGLISFAPIITIILILIYAPILIKLFLLLEIQHINLSDTDRKGVYKGYYCIVMKLRDWKIIRRK